MIDLHFDLHPPRTANDVPLFSDHFDGPVGFANESLLHHIHSERAVRGAGDRVLIDADIRFNAHEVVQLLKSEKDVICGIYPKKEINWDMVQQAVKDGVQTNDLKKYTGSFVVNLVDYSPTVTVPMHEPLEIWNGGTGMMCIKREVFEKLKDSVPVYNNDVVDLSGNTPVGEPIHEFFATSIEPETNRLLSEDYHFCRIWRLQGGKIYAAPWMNLGHVGTYIFEGELIKSENSQEQ